MLYYDKRIGDHSFGLTLLQSQTGIQGYSNITGNGVPLSSQLWNALSSGTVTGQLSTRTNIIEQQILSYMARLNYGFKDKYLLTVSARQDGSSVLAEGHKYSLFPSAALAWRINKERFMKVNWINDLKLRIGAGVTGNSAIAPYQHKALLHHSFIRLILPMLPVQYPIPFWQTRNWDGKKQLNIISE